MFLFLIGSGTPMYKWTLYAGVKCQSFINAIEADKLTHQVDERKAILHFDDDAPSPKFT